MNAENFSKHVLFIGARIARWCYFNSTKIPNIQPYNQGGDQEDPKPCHLFLDEAYVFTLERTVEYGYPLLCRFLDPNAQTLTNTL